MEVAKQASLLGDAPDPDREMQGGGTPETQEPNLKGQLERVLAAMQDGEWRSLAQIQDITGDPQSSISARLRDLKKEKFGAYDIQKRQRGNQKSGVWESRVGEKGAGNPTRREKAGDVPRSYLILAKIADSILRHAKHQETCVVFDLRESRPCNCGLGPALTAYRAARKETLRYEEPKS